MRKNTTTLSHAQFKAAKIIAWHAGNRDFAGLSFNAASAEQKQALTAILTSEDAASQQTPKAAPKPKASKVESTTAAPKGRLLPDPASVAEGKTRKGRKDGSKNRVSHVWMSARTKDGVAFWKFVS